ncbi:hypothetical protein ACFL4G_00925 [Thermodesulfobacteriota bacterium]
MNDDFVEPSVPAAGRLSQRGSVSIVLLVVVGIVVLISWKIMRPHFAAPKVKQVIEKATLHGIDMSDVSIERKIIKQVKSVGGVVAHDDISIYRSDDRRQLDIRVDFRIPSNFIVTTYSPVFHTSVQRTRKVSYGGVSTTDIEDTVKKHIDTRLKGFHNIDQEGS